MDLQNLEPHPLADQFPEMSPLEFAALKADIEANGQNESIIIFEGKILDGRNRYRACKELKLEPKIEPFEGDYERAEKWSMSANLTRRHLSKSQKAMYVAKFGLAAAPKTDSNGQDSIRDAALKYGVNHMTIYKAFFVLGESPDLADAVMRGELSVGKAENSLRSPEQKSSRSQGNSEPVADQMLKDISRLLKRNKDPEARRRSAVHLARALKALSK